MKKSLRLACAPLVPKEPKIFFSLPLNPQMQLWTPEDLPKS